MVATRAEGVAELLGEAAPSQTAEFGDLSCFLERIRDLAAAPARTAALGAANQERARETLSLSAMIATYEQLYSQLASSSERE